MNVEVIMKYFIKEESSPYNHQFFKHLKYEIPLQEITLIKKHKRERVTYALYSEEESVYLLTQVSVINDQVCGYGSYARPYCKVEEINNYSLKTLDSDAYNWYMTQAR